MLKVIEIALNEVGYLEKKSNNDLDSKTGNAGAANYTKFARDLDAISGFYNGKKQGFSWCDVFVDWCFMKAYGATTAKKMLYQPDKSLGAGCLYSANYFKVANAFYNSPKVGDQIFFIRGGKVVHTGLVYAIDSTFVYTVEGNTSGASGVIENGGGVCKKAYALKNSAIYGYGRPNYSLVPQPAPQPTKEKTGVDVKMQIIRQGSKGKAVRVWQAILGFTGNNIDGDFGSNTLKKTREFQKAHNLTVDGIVGTKTWKAGLESV